MITFKRALEIHSILIDTYGGHFGVRDHSLLESALKSPHEILGDGLYLSAVDKAAVVLESILKNSPFVDGNRRTGYVLARLVLLSGNLDLIAEDREKYRFLLQVSRGDLDLEQIRKWIRDRVIFVK